LRSISVEIQLDFRIQKLYLFIEFQENLTMNVFKFFFNHKEDAAGKSGTTDDKNHADKPIIHHTTSGRQFISPKDLLKVETVREEIKSLAKLEK